MITETDIDHLIPWHFYYYPVPLRVVDFSEGVLVADLWRRIGQLGWEHVDMVTRLNIRRAGLSTN